MGPTSDAASSHICTSAASESGRSGSPTLILAPAFNGHNPHIMILVFPIDARPNLAPTFRELLDYEYA